MKFTDLIAEFFEKNNIDQVFGLQGGAVVHIFDSLEKKILMLFTHTMSPQLLLLRLHMQKQREK